MAVILITGGARSGKSKRAEMRTRAFPGQPVYVATAEALDTEMEARIAKHRARRGTDWIEREVPLDLVPALVATDGGGARLVDCLTLWLSNLMHAERDWEREIEELAGALPRLKSPVVLVTNEVGLGIHPETELGRRYRDLLGRVNRIWAQAAERSLLIVAGRSLPLHDPWELL